MPAATASRPSSSGLRPKPGDGAEIGGTAAGCGGGGWAAGGASSAGSTQPVGACAAVATVAAPHMAAAGAPPLITLSRPHGLACGEGAEAAAAVEPNVSDAATSPPMIRWTISFLRH